jgi:diguanylate cyclase (GGDEF)-like protein
MLASPRVRLALYVVATVFLPMAAIGAIVVEITDPEERGVYQWVVVLGAALAGIVTYLAVRVSLLSTARGIAEMTQRARAITIGHVGRWEPVPESGPQEIAKLARAFNDMLARVRQYLDDLARSQAVFRRTVARLGDVFASTHDRDTIMEVALEAAALVADARAAVFWHCEDDRLVAARTWGEVKVRVALPVGSGVAGHVALERQPWIGEPDQRAPTEPHFEHAMAAPLQRDGVVHGVIAVYGRTKPLDYDPEDLAALRSLVRQAEAAIVNTYRHEEAQRLSVTDSLTGLINRRELLRRMTDELERAQRFGESVGLVLIDLDDFKQVNDTHGHPAGDAVLAGFAGRLDGMTRQVDVVARLGGEELAIMLPHTGRPGAIAVAKELCRAVAAEPLDTPVGPVVVTASLGVAAFPQCAADLDALMAAADAALYRAKAAGKNRVEAASVVGPAVAPRRPRRRARGAS